jgi:short-subunit dehydrogenase
VVLVARTESKLIAAVEALKKTTSSDSTQVISYVSADCTNSKAIQTAVDKVRKMVPNQP